MSEATLKVPAEHVETFRENVYSCLAGEGDALEISAGTLAFPGGHSQFIGGDPDKIEQHAVRVLKASRNIAALVEVMEQLEWTDPIEGDVELAADAKVLDKLVDGCLVDAGDTVHGVMEAKPFKRAAFDTATAWAAWLADRKVEIEEGSSVKMPGAIEAVNSPLSGAQSSS